MEVRITILIASWICLLFIANSNGYRILGIFVFPVPSHYFLGSALLKGLAEAGHDITIISPFSQKSLPENGTWREIVLKSISDTYERNNYITKLSKSNQHSTWMQYIELFKYVSETTLNNIEVQDLIHSKEKFDAVIIPELLMNSLKAFAAHFNAHLITFNNFGGYNYCYNDIGVPSLPSHSHELSRHSFSQGKLNYLDRIRNMCIWAIRTVLVSFYLSPHQADLVKRHFPNVSCLNDIIRNTSLMLVNSHPSTNYQHPKVPTMVDIGGFHLKPPKKLPDNLQTILDNANNGFIYFSLGSNMKPEHVPKEKVEVFLKVFAERKELILWKYSESHMPGKPDNVILGNWFPQQDILGHPNIKLFITHGGFSSLIETIYNGVPTITIPLVIDQMLNALFSVENGLGLTVNWEGLTEEILRYSIEEVISNSKYLGAVKESSLVLKDRIKPPMEEAIYWVEYVIKHNGAKHLKVPYLGMPWYQFYLLDIIGTFIIGIFVVIWLMKKLILSIFGIFKKVEKLKTV